MRTLFQLLFHEENRISNQRSVRIVTQLSCVMSRFGFFGKRLPWKAVKKIDAEYG
tara:strand:+ start:3219 stop:3383 length:165 start_codon:yes stop_codon:yes gene_type:complete